MKKLIRGIVEFRRSNRAGYIANYGGLAAGQSPDTLFIGCSDSRVMPNTFASTNPGDLFVLRNVGNLVPICGEGGHSSSDESEAAAIEFSVLTLNVNNIIVCGHSDCGAMRALTVGRDTVKPPNLKSWLRHGEPAIERLKKGQSMDTSLSAINQLSQLNVRLQIEHVKTYPAVKERIESGALKVHGWWFDLGTADVYALDEELGKFNLIDETEAERLINKIEDKK